MNKRKIFGILIMVLGFCIFMYPIVRQANAKRVQNNLMKDIREVIKENMDISATEDTSDTNDNDSDLNTTLEEEYADLTLTQEVQQETENPENVRDRLKNQTVMGIIEIDKIDLIYAVVEGTSDDNLGVAIGHMKNTAKFGQPGNCVLAGHRGGISGPYFKKIDKLKVGDPIKLTDANGVEYTYLVTESFIVEPTEVCVAENNTDEKILTLITCEDNSTKRLIVRAKAS